MTSRNKNDQKEKKLAVLGTAGGSALNSGSDEQVGFEGLR